MKTEKQWTELLVKLGVRSATAARWGKVFAAEISDKTFSKGKSEVDDFLGQVLHESGMLERIEESLTYSTPERLMAVWPSRFPSRASALKYVRDPAALAEKVYSGRMGNVNPGDGFRFRGRGLLQVTGRANYTELGKIMGLPLAERPDMLSEPAIALRASIAWWERNVPDSIMGDIKRVTKAVNGGMIGIDHRAEMTAKVAKALA